MWISCHHKDISAVEGAMLLDMLFAPVVAETSGLFGTDCASGPATYDAALKVHVEVVVIWWDRHCEAGGRGLDVDVEGEAWMMAEDSFTSRLTARKC